MGKKHLNEEVQKLNCYDREKRKTCIFLYDGKLRLAEVGNILKQKVLAGAFLLTNGRMEREMRR